MHLIIPVLPKSTRSMRSFPVPLSPAIGLITMPVCGVCVCVCVRGGVQGGEGREVCGVCVCGVGTGEKVCGRGVLG